MALLPLHLLKERIVDRYDVDYVVDVMGLDVEMILNKFEDELEECRWRFSELEEDEGEDE